MRQRVQLVTVGQANVPIEVIITIGKMDVQIDSFSNPNIDTTVPQKWWSGKWTKVLIGLAFVGLVVGVILFTTSRRPFGQNRVEMKIEGPAEVAAGELATYKVVYENKNEIQLLNAKIRFDYPDDAVPFEDGDIRNVTNTTVDIGTIEPNSKGEKEFKVFVAGDKGNIRVVKAQLTFSVDGIRSVLEKKDEISTTITSLALPITLVAPVSVQNGQTISYIVDYHNQGPEDLTDLRIKLTYPVGFRSANLDPGPFDGNNIWNLPIVRSGESDRITIEGKLSGSEGETKTVIAVVQKKIPTPQGDRYVDLQKIETKTDITSSPLSVRLLLNNSKDYLAHLSDRLRYTMEVRNNSQFNFSALNVSAKLSGSMFDFSSVDTNGAFDSRTGALTWNSVAVPLLGNLPPGVSTQMVFEVKIKNNFPSGFGTKDAFVKVSATAVTDSVPLELSLAKLSSDDEINTRISSAPVFKQQLFVQDTVFGASGPFPPKVDKKTTLAVRWTLINPASDVTGSKIIATLAPGVSWENKVRSSGIAVKPTFNSRTNTVMWDIGTLSAGAGISGPIYEGVFVISIMPSVNQIGQQPKLLTVSDFSGTDSFTKEKFSTTIREVDTGDVVDSELSRNVRE